MRALPALVLLALLACSGELPELPASRPRAADRPSVGVDDESMELRRARVSTADEEPTDRREELPFAESLLVTGQVVDARTDQGVAGWRVRLTCRDDRYEATSDAGGTWALRIPAGDDAVNLWVRPNPSWRWRCPAPRARLYGHRLTPAERAGERPLHIEVAERLARPIHGIAVDAETGALLPHFPFRVFQSGIQPNNTVLVTDEAGRFVSDEPVQGGNVKVSSGDGEGRPVEAEFDLLHDDEPLTLAFEAGPWIDVALVGHVPEDVGDLEFAVLRRGQAKPCARTHVRVAPSGELWARPPFPRNRPAPSERVSLFVVDRAGHRLGHMDATWGELFASRDGPPLVFPMEITGAVRVTAVYADRPAPREGELIFGPAGAGIHVRTDMPGASFPGVRWRVAAGKWLPPGAALVSAEARAYFPAERTVETVAGTTQEVKIALDPVPDLRGIRGRVRMSTGAPFDHAEVTIALRDDPSSSWRVTWERERSRRASTGHVMREEILDGVATARFWIGSVPAGPLDVTARHGNSPCTVELREEPSGNVEIDVVFQVDGSTGADREAVRPFGVRAVDAGTGEVLRVVSTTRVRDGGAAFSAGRDWMGRGDPRAREFDWAVHRAGWRPAYGTERDFQRDAEGNYRVEVALEKGWGTRLEVLGPEDAPVAGAAVLLDGEEAGHTDAGGRLELSRETKPYGIEIRASRGEVLVLDPSDAAWQTARMRGR